MEATVKWSKRHMRDEEAEVADADSRVCEWSRAIGQ